MTKVRGRTKLTAVAVAAADCTNCDLYRNATQTVFGTGPVGAALMLVGEQPGDKEDIAGEPFVGPAGAILRRALGDAGIDEGDGLFHQRREAFQVGTLGKGSPSQEAERR